MDSLLQIRELDETALASLQNPEGLIEGDVIYLFLHRIIQTTETRIAFIHPNYVAQFFMPNETILEDVQRNSSIYPARNFLYGDSEFDILIIPFHIRQLNEWYGGEHWMLAIYDKDQIHNGRIVCRFYDPKPKRNENNRIILNNDYRIILRHIFKTVKAGICLRANIIVQQTDYNTQAVDDFSSCGAHVCYYARQYIINRNIEFDQEFDVQNERLLIYRTVTGNLGSTELIDNEVSRVAKDMAKLSIKTHSDIEKKIMLDEKSQSKDLIRILETEEQIRDRQDKDRDRKQEKRKLETEEQTQDRLDKNRDRTQKKRKLETEEQTQDRRDKDRDRTQEKRNLETEEQTRDRRDKNRYRTQEKRNLETEEQTQDRLDKDRDRKQEKRNLETEEQTQDRRDRNRDRTQEKRNLETEEQTQDRRDKNRDRMTVNRLNEPDSIRSQRLKKIRERQTIARKRRQLITFKSTYKCANNANDVIYNQMGDFNIKCCHCGALHFFEERTINSISSNSFMSCCSHGKLQPSSNEALSGIPVGKVFPTDLAHLFLKTHSKSKQFRFHDRIRILNNSFALASLCVQSDRTPSSGIYAFTVGGQIYHKMNLAAYPTSYSQSRPERPVYGQLYFMDATEAVEERINQPTNFIEDEDANRELLMLLDTIIREYNIFAQSFEMMREVEEQVKVQAWENNIKPPNVNLVFTTDLQLNDRKFAVPVVNEVSAVIVLNADGSIPENIVILHPTNQSEKAYRNIPWLKENEIEIRQEGKELLILSNADPRIEPFVYPLFFPCGTFGWHTNLFCASKSKVQKRITRLMFARYRIAFRYNCYLKEYFDDDDEIELGSKQLDPDNHFDASFNALHFGEKLFQQYCVDTFIRIERDRIVWIKNNQDQLRAQDYSTVNDYLDKVAENEHLTICRKVILPSTFPGSPRYYAECYDDAMAIVRRFGRPDLFITMTCNPKWPEIQAAIRHNLVDGSILQQMANMRPDIVARVFKIKFNQLIKDIFNQGIFGKAIGYVSVIEFQKRGLPHMHMLIILDRNDKLVTPEHIDQFISAEIPNREDDPDLYRIVEQHMIHGPCGKENPEAPCMNSKSGKCRWKFPKSFQNETTLPDEKAAEYRRRPPESNDYCVYRKNKNLERVQMNNQNVVPYNPWLSKRYDCHINVEHVGGIKAVKYLYKYIYKGHDVAQIKVVNDEKSVIYDECERHIEGRYIGACEACWRMFEFDLQQKSHTVTRLDIHLEKRFDDQMQNLPEDLLDVAQKNSTLQAWFKLNQNIRELELKQVAIRQQAQIRPLSSNEKNILKQSTEYHFYWEIPEFYTWHAQIGEWRPMRRRVLRIGRIYTVSPILVELFHFRILLFHVKRATCHNDFLNYEGVHYESFKKVCVARGLAFNDQEWFDALREHCLFKMPNTMRTFFAIILMYNRPVDPKNLWESFKEDLAEDFIKIAREQDTSIEKAIQKAYRIIADIIDKEASEGRHFQYWIDTYGMDSVVIDYDDDIEENLNDNMEFDETESIGFGLDQLNVEQRVAADAILEAADSSDLTAHCFFIDGPGGTGKSFLFNTVYHLLLAKGKRVLNMATTGIASTLLPNGETAHRAFKLDVPLEASSKSRIKIKSKAAERLKCIDVFFLDEAPMLARYGLENIDDKLKELRNCFSIPFGGAVIVLGGDFRQCLPVQVRANKSELRNLSIKSSWIWNSFKVFRLTQNMRVDSEEVGFKEWLLAIGNGTVNTNSSNKILLPQNMICYHSLVEEVFGPCFASNDFEAMQQRAILCPYNLETVEYNNLIINRLPGQSKIYCSFDKVKDQIEGGLDVPSEVLNKLESADLPPHELKIKINTIVMLIRNLKVSEGLCNGSRILVTDLEKNVIHGKIITAGCHYGRKVSIPRITIESGKNLGFILSRHQFPLKPALAMTIHKSQGQTFDFIGIDLTQPVFGHGQLYVAFSRARRQSNIKIKVDEDLYVTNIVDRLILD